jgi:hypothetical protein
VGLDIHPSTSVRPKRDNLLANCGLQEGLFTACVGLTGFLLIPSTPRHSKFLTFEQKEWAIFPEPVD